MDKESMKVVKSFLSNRIRIKDGSIQLLFEGGEFDMPSNAFPAGGICPYCGRMHIRKTGFGSDEKIEEGSHTWNIYACFCHSCESIYVVLIDEFDNCILFCNRGRPELFKTN